jgi:hypothetical protein
MDKEMVICKLISARDEIRSNLEKHNPGGSNGIDNSYLVDLREKKITYFSWKYELRELLDEIEKGNEVDAERFEFIFVSKGCLYGKQWMQIIYSLKFDKYNHLSNWYERKEDKYAKNLGQINFYVELLFQDNKIIVKDRYTEENICEIIL